LIQINVLEILTRWSSVLNSARTTVGKEAIEKDPTTNWKKKILLAEHSPIRLLFIRWKWKNIKSWVSVHFVRHKIGIEHFVRTQRVDRTGEDRDHAPQDSPVDHECIANAQAIINISRKRLCTSASPETREAWKLFLKDLKTLEPELYSVCVCECLYRGFCPQLSSCGYSKTKDFEDKLKDYRKV